MAKPKKGTAHNQSYHAHKKHRVLRTVHHFVHDADTGEECVAKLSLGRGCSKTKTKRVSEELLIRSFEDMHLKADLLKGIKDYGYVMPTAVQKATIVHLYGKLDVFARVAVSKPGRTSSICIGILQKLDCTFPKCQAVVVTRDIESAEEIGMAMGQLGFYLKVKVHFFGRDGVACPADVHVVVGPRYCLQKLLSYSWMENVKVVFFDQPEWANMSKLYYNLKEVLPRRENYNVCSFTEAEWPEVEQFVLDWMRKPVVKISAPVLLEACDHAERSHQVISVKNATLKFDELKNLLNASPKITSVVFVNNASMVGKLVKELKTLDLVEVLFTQKGMRQKTKDRKTQQLFEAGGRPRVLITTDEWVNDMDLKHVDVVVNYDMPSPDVYLSRMGRFGKQADAINFVTGVTWYLLFDIQELCKNAVIFEGSPLQPNQVGPAGFSEELVDVEGCEISKDEQPSPGIDHILFMTSKQESKAKMIWRNFKEMLANVKTVIFSKVDLSRKLEDKGFVVYAEDELEDFFKSQAVYCLLLITKDKYACNHAHPKVPLVINFDLPSAKEIYDHRIAWCGEKGVAFHFVTDEDWLKVFHFQSRQYKRAVGWLPADADLPDIVESACNAHSDYTYDWEA